MRIKELFTVPNEKKITEKIFSRVLISSVCSILLCMACLIGTTWAWFTVSVENTENEIQIATVTPLVVVTKEGVPIPLTDGTHYALEAGTYKVTIGLENNATGTDDLNKTQRNVIYVVMSVTQGSASKNYRLAFAGAEEIQLPALQIHGSAAEIRFSVSWIEPASATPIGSEAIVIDGITHS